MSVYSCVQNFKGDVANGFDYVVKEVLPDKIVADIDPQNLTTPEDVPCCTEKLQPFVEAVTEVLQTGTKTAEELIQARIKGIPKVLTACFSRDKPWLRWLNFALLFPRAFDVTGNVVSLVGEGSEEAEDVGQEHDQFPDRERLGGGDGPASEEFAIGDYPVRGLKAGGIRRSPRELKGCKLI